MRRSRAAIFVLLAKFIGNTNMIIHPSFFQGTIIITADCHIVKPLIIVVSESQFY